jgi:hypothetical protein
VLPYTWPAFLLCSSRGTDSPASRLPSLRDLRLRSLSPLERTINFPIELFEEFPHDFQGVETGLARCLEKRDEWAGLHDSARHLVKAGIVELRRLLNREAPTQR